MFTIDSHEVEEHFEWIDQTLSNHLEPQRQLALWGELPLDFGRFRTAVARWEAFTGREFVVEVFDGGSWDWDVTDAELHEFARLFYGPLMEKFVEAVPVQDLKRGDRVLWRNPGDPEGPFDMWAFHQVTAVRLSGDVCTLHRIDDEFQPVSSVVRLGTTLERITVSERVIPTE
ncbi:hypothetical protein IU485_27790 [Nocardia cyriacigeorgica]|uniref:hypothetical protein n=1 Tax=Nocardia cyriacigeorgica TaxID=135487 RepID=UPI001895B8CB|nr:hypothetical protein [Nocardia cyriacigeorgica]MBF6085180.1 hypothetical protein [Nocardia cyriacigeorgica]